MSDYVLLLIAVPVILLLCFLAQKVFRMDRWLSAIMITVSTVFLYTGYAIYFQPTADVMAIQVAILGLSIMLGIILPGKIGTSKKWHWAPKLILAFFAVVIVTNSVFITLAHVGLDADWASWILPEPKTSGVASSKFPGVVSHDFREKSEQFNDYRESRKSQLEQGWKTRIGWEARPVVGEPNRLVLHITDQFGQEVAGATVSGKLLYPGDMKLDREFTMYYKGKGTYITPVTPDHAGDRDVIILISKPGFTEHELRMTTSVFPDKRDDT